MDKKNRIVITGMGAISAPGIGLRQGFHSVCAGKDCLTPLTLFDSRLKTVPLCAQVSTIPERFQQYHRTLGLAFAASEEAMSVLQDRSTVRLGVVVATTVGGISSTEKVYEELRADTAKTSFLTPRFAVHEPTVISGELCSHFGGSGFHTVSTACSTGLHAIGMAKRLIERGIYDACLAVGADALSILTIRGFASLTLLDPQGCRPFDKNRAGISLGEGAAAMLITSAEFAARQALQPVALVSGWGSSADCYHMTAPHPQGDGAQRAVLAALDEAGIGPDQIDLIAAHGTGTPDNDKAEIKAMQAICGKLPPFCSMKRTLGHTLAASGILEAVFAVKALCEGVIPPTGGFSVPDDEIGVVPSPPAKRTMNHILKNSFGFGGNNAAVIFSKVDA